MDIRPNPGLAFAMRDPRTASVRRLTALIQVAALMLSLGLQFGVSLCPPGMDMGMDMDMSIVVEGGDDTGHHDDGSACPFAGSPNEDGRTTCPFAVGGVGPCGTTVPAPSAMIASVALAGSSQLFTIARVSGHKDVIPKLQLPPPRA